MWFKQAQIFQLDHDYSYQPDALEEQLASMAFTPCLPSLPASLGFAPPIDLDGAPLVHAANGYLLFCLQIEEKVLPATVVRQAVNDRIKELEAAEDRKVYRKERNNLKDEMTFTLLPRAFTKVTRIHAYIDTKNHWLVINSNSASKVEKFLEIFKRTVSDIKYHAVEIKKIAPILTKWLLHNDHPRSFTIEKSCTLKDPNQQNRVIRCQHQDLSASPIQSLLKDGCEATQLSLNWQDRIRFTLCEDFSLKTIGYDDEILNLSKDNYSETKEQQFDTDFMIMTESLAPLFRELIEWFAVDTQAVDAGVVEEVVA